MLKVTTVRDGLVDLEDEVYEIRHIAAFLGAASEALINSQFSDPFPCKNGLKLCFDFLKIKLDSLQQSVEDLKTA
jgi:hypothetical protein